MKNLYIVLVMVVTLIILSGCTNEQPAELMFEPLEESVQIEQDIETKQGPLTEAEQNEAELYTEMLTLSSVEEIELLADEAIASAESRRTIMEEEYELIEESYTVFQEIEPHVEEIDEEEAEQKTHGEELIQVMDERYDVYQELHEVYMASIEDDITLYEMAKTEDVEVEDLQAQHEIVNESYSQITSLNDQFNELTSSYNEAKVAFYEASDLDINFE
ncbi:YkyA family protein [Salipaludibacillus sp. CF4.18]|uniref:YkyA family protein n=1 Tax=Salipaludibacillus sp. CF4.18 TaxID=3373081 RepID=UPI003EE48879